MIEHTADRPSWNCRACAKPWPCDPARQAMAAQFIGYPSVLRIYLAAQLADACDDIPDVTAEELYDRFMAWPSG